MSELIRPNCRDHLTAADMDFIVNALANDEKSAGYLREFLVDSDTRDMVLDHSALFIEHNTRYRAAPGVDYYENLGRASYEVASHHRLAEQYHLDTVYAALAEAFHDTRLALNDMTERLLTLNDQHVWRAQNMPQK